MKKRFPIGRVPAGLDGVTSFALYEGSTRVIEGQSDHFWDPANTGPDANPPLRIVEVHWNKPDYCANHMAYDNQKPKTE